MNNPNRDKESAKPTQEHLFAPFALVVIGASVAAFEKSDLFTFLTFFGILIVYAVRKYDFRILIGIGLLLLLLSDVQLIRDAKANAIKGGNAAFYFLATGVIGELIRHVKAVELIVQGLKWIRERRKGSPRNS